MKIICSWCKNSLGEKEPLDNPAATHTICPECREKVSLDDEPFLDAEKLARAKVLLDELYLLYEEMGQGTAHPILDRIRHLTRMTRNGKTRISMSDDKRIKSVSFAPGITVHQMAVAFRLLAELADECETHEQLGIAFKGISFQDRKHIATISASFMDGQYEKLLEAIGKACHESCCGDSRAGIRTGAEVALGVLGIKVDAQQFYQDVGVVENQLYEEQYPERTEEG